MSFKELIAPVLLITGLLILLFFVVYAVEKRDYEHTLKQIEMCKDFGGLPLTNSSGTKLLDCVVKKDD